MNQRKDLQEFEKMVDETAKRLENDKGILMRNINSYNVEEIEQLSLFFESIDTIFKRNFSKLCKESQFIKNLKVTNRMKVIKEINDALYMFEKDISLKNENNIQK